MSEQIELNVSAASMHEPSGDETAKDQRHNYWVSIIEGGTFIGGISFLNTQALLPDIVRQLGGSPILIALTPSLMAFGFLVCPILTAHWVDGMHRYMPITSVCGLGQRIPYLFAAIALYLAAAGFMSTGALITVIAAPVVSGLAGGISVTAWQQLTARCIPENRRASAFAWRYVLSCVLGVSAGFVVKYLLAHCSLLNAFATLHLITFVLFMISYFVFITTREPKTPPPHVHTLTLGQNLALMPRLINQTPTFRRYLLSRVFRCGTLVITPFLAIYARERLSLPESFLGTLVIANMVGAIVGNVGAARMGDRTGGKLSSQLALVLYILVAGWSIFANTRAEFVVIFAIMGMALYAGDVGAGTLVLELLPKKNRATYLAITSLSNLPAMAIAGWISSAFWKHSHSITPLAIVTMVTLAISFLLLHPVKEPRKRLCLKAE